MLAAHYKTKTELKKSLGKQLKYVETSLMGKVEYSKDGTFSVVGPSSYNRKFFAEATMKNNLIVKVT